MGFRVGHVGNDTRKARFTWGSGTPIGVLAPGGIGNHLWGRMQLQRARQASVDAKRGLRNS